MMSDDKRLIARRYAQAILNHHKLSYDGVKQAREIARYFKDRSTTGVFLRLSSISSYDKISVILRIVKHYCNASDRVFHVIESMLQVLVEHKRLPMFPMVCNMLLYEYQRRHNIESCTVMTSHEVSAQDIETIVAWLEQHTQKTLEVSHTVNASLIAGVRVHGDTFVWENSIDRKLKNVQQETRLKWGIR